jgi:hypothetical protein
LWCDRCLGCDGGRFDVGVRCGGGGMMAVVVVMVTLVVVVVVV